LQQAATKSEFLFLGSKMDIKITRPQTVSCQTHIDNVTILENITSE